MAIPTKELVTVGHTLGPWNVSVEEDGRVLVLDSLGISICEMDSDNADVVTNLRDGKVIAAAPDLLAAAKAWLAADDPDGKAYTIAEIQAIHALQAAVEKAERI